MEAALLRTLVAWGLVLGAGALEGAGPAGIPTLVAFGLAALAVGPGAGGGVGRHRRVGEFAAVAVLAAVAGFSLAAAGLALTWKTGLVLGLDPRTLGAPVPPAAGGPATWAAGVVAAPAFEEPLYRGWWLRALRERVPALPAIAGSALLFALPHGDAWSVMGATFAGLGLGGLAWWTGGLAAPFGLHAGLNLAVVVGGVPPGPGVPTGAPGAALGLVVLTMAAAVAHRSRAR